LLRLVGRQTALVAEAGIAPRKACSEVLAPFREIDFGSLVDQKPFMLAKYGMPAA
jgi:hypothetical protein